MSSEIEKKISNATKWSSVSEIIAKLVLPITNLVLARLLTPEMFGVVATVTMIVSLADLFTDAGFQKYLIQNEFVDEIEQKQCTNVAFWSNLILSITLFIIIVAFRNRLAVLVGNPGLGSALMIASISLPLTSFASIQMAIFKRDFDFKTLFIARWIGLCVPIFVTVPLAFATHSFWALIVGTIAQNLINAVFLTIKSPWKPEWYFSFVQLGQMLSFSIWTTIEQISIWLTKYLDIFIVGVCLSQYYLGIYKTSMTTVNQITTVVTAATTPVLFSALSRLQNDSCSFKAVFFNFQRKVGYLIIPLGVGIFLYRDFIVKILLGRQWIEAVNFVGLWGLMSTITILFSNYSSEVYRALGKPKLSFLSQCLHLIILIPVVFFSAQHGYESLYVARSIVRIEAIAVDFVILYFLTKISPIAQIRNVFCSLVATGIMSFCAICFRTVSDNIFFQFFSIMLCIIVYFCSVIIFKSARNDLMPIIDCIIKIFKNTGIGRYYLKKKDRIQEIDSN